MAGLTRLCVFCGSKHGDQVAFTTTARKVGATLAYREIGLVYGGGDVGLMGELADAALEAGGEVVGVIPEFMVEHEIAHRRISELHVVASMHERKATMAQLADGFLALPGGWGTLEELFEVVTWAQLGLHAKPVGLLDVAGFYDRLVEFLDGAVDAGFIRPRHRGILRVDDDVDRLLDALSASLPADGLTGDDVLRT